LGSVPVGPILARARGVNLQKVGSGNIGATNVRRALGLRFGVLALALDTLKGLVPTLIAREIAPTDPFVAPAVGLAAVLGHMFSVFLKGHGGKGVATTFGAALGLAPMAAKLCAAVYAAIYAVVRIPSVSSLTAVALFPVLLWRMGSRTPGAIHAATLWFAVSAAVLVFVRHHGNLHRLLRGEEGRL
jgi:glycerol-3-phosphate acyltransferase PlsY